MKAVKIVIISIGTLFVLGVIGLMYVGANSPETYIYTENEIPEEYLEILDELTPLNKNENVLFFYSDALFDIKDGIYALTDQRLIIYCQEWDDPEAIIEFDDIVNLNIEYDDSFLTDSFITVETDYEMIVEFPVSSEKGRDKQFFQYLEQKVREAHSSIRDTTVVF
ncbi:MAG: hypothetical protein ACJA0U_001945 [Salibacteraceae bacterium]|jgi:hypothetical protein